MNRRMVLACVSLLAACDGGGSSTTDAPATIADAAAPDSGSPDAPMANNFSFFVTSLATMRSQSGSQDGFGGNLGGLAGADAICQRAAMDVGAGAKTWRAFLSVTTGGGIHAIDRIGNGPWYDKNGLLIAMNKAGLLQNRPAGDTTTVNDLPDETGIKLTTLGDSHDVMTGSNNQGRLQSTDPTFTCMDWTSASADISLTNKAYVGHSWPSQSGQNWMQAHRMRGCAPGVNLIQNGPGTGNCVGCGGGWGGIYCFALTP